MDLATIGFKADTSGLVKAERGLDSLAATGKRTETSLSSLQKTVGVVGTALAALGSASIASQLAKYADVATNIENRLRTVTSSTAELASAQQRLLSIANATRSEYQTTAELYTKLTQSTTELGLSQDRLYRITETINKSFASSGASATEASNAIRQLAQGLSAGALRGDEFNSVAEQAPDILRAVAAETGKTVGELRKFAEEGGITAELLISALENYEKTIDRTYSKTNATLEQNTEIARNNAIAWVESNKTIMGATALLGSALVAASENIDALTTAGTAAAAVFGVYLVASLGKSAAAFLSATAQAAAYQATLARMAGVSATAAAATSALGAATSFLLGPWGLLITALGAAAAAFVLTKDSAAEATVKLDSQAAAVDKLAEKYMKFSSGNLAQTYASAQLQAIELSERRIQIEGRLAELAGRSDVVAYSERKRLNAELLVTNSNLEKAELSIQAVNKVFDQSIPKAESMTNGMAKVAKATGMTAKEVKNLKDKIDGLNESMDDHFLGLEMIDEIDQNRIKNLEDQIDAVLEWEGETTGAVNNVATVSEKAAERIENAFADAWLNAFDGFESVVDGMKNAFKRLLAEMAHMALTKPIMISLGMGGLLPGGASAATGAGGLSSLGSLGGIAGMLGGLGAGFTGSATLLGAGQVGTAFGLTGNLFAAGEIMTGIGAALPIIAAGAAIAGVVDKISGGGLFGTSYKTTAQDLSLALGGGNVTGSITTEESKKRALFGGTKRRTSTSAFDTSSIDAAFDEIQAALASAAQSIGITGADEVLKNFTASFNLSVKDKSQTEIDAAIQEWVAGTTSSMVEAVFGDMLGGLQVEGETLLDTLNRVAGNMAAVASITQALGLNYDLTGKAAAEAATNIVNLAGGIDQLSALSTQYYQSFYSETERQLMLQQQLAEQFSALNVTMPDTREGFRALVDGLDLSTTAGQEMFAALMQLVPGMDQYLQALEAQKTATDQAAEAMKSQEMNLQLRLYEALGQSAEALALKRQMELDATDESLRAMLLAIYAAEDAATAQRELAAAQEKAAAAAKSAAQDAFGKLSDAVNAAISAQDDLLQRRLESIAIEREAITSLIESLKGNAQNAFGKLEEAASAEISASQSALDQRLSAIDAEREAINRAASDAQSAYSNQISSAEQFADSIRAISDVLRDFVASGTNAISPFTRLTQILSEAKAGILPNQSELSSVLGGISNAGSDGFSSAFDQQRATAIARSQAAELQGLMSARMSDAERQIQIAAGAAADSKAYYDKQLAKLDEAAEAAQAQHDQTVSGINAQVEEAKKQLNALLGVDDRVLTLEQALKEFTGAMSEAGGISMYEQQLKALDDQEALAIEQHKQSVDALNAQLDEAKKRLNVLLGIDDRMLTVEQAMAEFNAAMLDAQTAQVTAIERVETAIIQLGEQIIEINKPEDRVWVPPTMPVSFTNEGEPVTREMVDLLKELTKISKANNENSSKSASLLQEMTIGGLDVRVEA